MRSAWPIAVCACLIGAPAWAQPEKGEEKQAPTDDQEEKPEEKPEEKKAEEKPAAEPAAPEPAPSVDPGSDVVETPAQVQARARRERETPRPPLPEVEAPPPPPWERHVEIGVDFVLAIRPFADAVVEQSKIGYDPAPGFGIHLHWEIIKWLRFHPYFYHAIHSIDVPQDALVVPGDPLSIANGATLSEISAESFAFGAKLAPTLPITDRLRAWLAVGIGWGRFSFEGMTVTEPGIELTVMDRSGVFVEFPLGLGISFDVIERWLAIEYEAIAAPIIGQSGDAHEVFQAVDDSGAIRNIGPLGAIEVTFLQILGVSLIL